MSEEKIVIPVSLRPQTKVILNQICDERGMKQIEVMSRLVEWFANLHPDIQAIILGQISRVIQPDFARILLEKIALEQETKNARFLEPKKSIREQTRDKVSAAIQKREQERLEPPLPAHQKGA